MSSQGRSSSQSKTNGTNGTQIDVTQDLTTETQFLSNNIPSPSMERLKKSIFDVQHKTQVERCEDFIDFLKAHLQSKKDPSTYIQYFIACLQRNKDDAQQFFDWCKTNPKTPMVKKLKESLGIADGSPTQDDVIAFSTFGGLNRDQYREAKRLGIISDSFPTPNSVEMRRQK